jgi:hypothetical protein
MFGSPEQREASALGMGDLIELTTPQALGPFVIKITGPLIRIIGDRFPPKVKLAILRTLSYGSLRPTKSRSNLHLVGDLLMSLPVLF